VNSLASPYVADATERGLRLISEADGLDWFDGMGQGNADDYRLMLTDERAARAGLLENDGHLTLLSNRISEVHAWLADRL
jgi:hypothetical protein